VLACAVRLLDRGFFRVVTEEYARENETYGLATIRKEHVALRDNQVTFDYPGKGGRRRIRSAIDPHVADVVAALKRRRSGGRELLASHARGAGGGRSWVAAKSADINQFVKECTGGFHGKGFPHLARHSRGIGRDRPSWRECHVDERTEAGDLYGGPAGRLLPGLRGLLGQQPEHGLLDRCLGRLVLERRPERGERRLDRLPVEVTVEYPGVDQPRGGGSPATPTRSCRGAWT
jgi:hypothetical protein